ncbi:aromatic ring-hydroxylating oxygenase subunit alpha [Verticiella sediminum]|nr:SRPBCC family protein [Verticiella sediminum]
MNSVIPIMPVLSESEQQALFAPVEVADGLPGRVYSNPEYWALERERLFKEDWFAIGCASDVPAVGDVMPVGIAGWELVLVRGLDDRVRVFHNICRHRGTKLVTKPDNLRMIQCGWHCWTYDLEGRLQRMPILNGPNTSGHDCFERESLGLVEARSGVWHDTVFVNLDGKARSFEAFTASLARLFEPYHLEGYDLTHPARHDEVVLDINWKLYHEGGLEGYHIPFVHPALELPDRYHIDNDPEAFTSLTGSLIKYKRLGAWVGLPDDTFDMNPAAAAAVSEGRRIPYTICFVTPTVIFAAWPEAIITTLLRPISPTRTGVRRNMYFIGDSAISAEAAPARQKYVDIWLGITGEDADYSTGVQRLSAQREEIGMQTRFSPYWEEAVKLFQQGVARRAYGASAA